MEPLAGIEPALSTLPKWCFTTKLQRPGQVGPSIGYVVYGPAPYLQVRLRHEIATGPSDCSILPIFSRQPSQGTTLYRNIFDRHKENGIDLRTVHGEGFDLSRIRATRSTVPMRMRAIAIENYRTISQSSSLYLNSLEHAVFVGNEVVAMILAERNRNEIAGTGQCSNCFDLGAISNRFRVTFFVLFLHMQMLEQHCAICMAL